jgi:5-methylcytosine-specific restriction protein B
MIEGVVMTEPDQLSASNLRRAQVNRAICEFLRDRSEPTPVREVLQYVMDVLPPTPAEAQINRGRMKYVTFIRWASTVLVQADLIVKSGVQGLWEITPKGMQALEDYSTDVDLYRFMLDIALRKRRERRALRGGLGPWGLVDGIVARVPTGKWVSFSDLEVVTGKAPGMTGIHMWNEKPTGWHRVLRQSGQMPAEAYDVQARADEQRALLEREGIAVDPRAPESMRISIEELEEIAASVRVPPRAWLVRGTSVRGASIIPEWLEEGFVSLPASQLPTLPVEPSESEIKAAVEQGYEGLGYSQRQTKADEIRTFVGRLQPGHLVMTTSESEVYIGEIIGDVQQVESPGRRSNLRREVAWANASSPADVHDLSSRLGGRLRSPADIVDLTEFYEDVAALASVEESAEELSDESELADNKLEAFMHLEVGALPGVHIDRRWLDELIDLLNDKPQVILYGPPGTGKTFLAQEVAEALAGPERVTLVQFHPSYSYEDFFEGYRPTGSGDGGVALALVPGPFRKVVDAARANPSEPHFLIIDEINRANLAKVFGELYFLLEYRERSIQLLYSSGDDAGAFSLPENVFMIGTMNTADRSIALVDAAMRRRFLFHSLHPEEQRLDEVLRAWLEARGLPQGRADLLVELNRRIPDKDFKLGPSYLMTPAVADESGLDRIWRSAILPLLEEYHLADGVDVESRYGLPALRRAIQASAAEPSE